MANAKPVNSIAAGDTKCKDRPKIMPRTKPARSNYDIDKMGVSNLGKSNTSGTISGILKRPY